MTFISRDNAGIATRVAAPAILGLTASRSRRYVRDNFATFDRATLDSAGSFLVGELERLDPMIHEPLISTTWTRDIDLRTDVTMGDTSSSYTVSSFGAVGGATPTGIAWAGAESTARPRSVLDIGKIANPLLPWSQDVAYTVWELESARQTGRPIDTQMLSALNRKHQMDTDQMVYVGDSTIGLTGLLNHTLITNATAIAAGVGGTVWSAKTPDEMLADINELLVSVWAASGYVAPPTKLALAPVVFGYISTVKVSSAGSETILSYVKERNILTAEKGIPLEIVSVKWLDKANHPSGTSDRMFAYSQRPEYVRFPLVPLVNGVVQPDGVWLKTPYYGKLGCVELVYPETVGVRTGLRT